MDDGGSGFGARLRLHRERAGLTQEALAERAGLTAAAIAALERERRRCPYPETLRRLAVFIDGCEIAGAEAICAGTDLPAANVLDLLTQPSGQIPGARNRGDGGVALPPARAGAAVCG